ncbi:MAG TPA: DUF2142 domain-containing protein [Candidatus Limnocylindria bacterium]|nr:DUF2142 domain-containing protein [Candidatus Limnocylindria bacterium]
MSICGGSKTFAGRNENVLVLLLCLVAALRVLIFSAAFPFFSNIDEDLHFDLITQYSRGHLPRAFEPLKEESLNWIVPYASPEFLFTADQFPGAKFPPPLWKTSAPEVEPEIAATRAAWSSEINFESSQPPLYYIIASLWWWVGKHIGLTGIQSLCWIRFLNLPLIAIVVWLGYVAARIVAPDRVDLRIGVPLLLAFIPQNVFYAMNNDVLSPVCFGALFVCVLQWLRTNAPSFLLGASTGLTIAATYLTKLSNLPLIAVVLAVITARLLLIIRRAPRTGLSALAALVALAAIPIGCWTIWLKFQFGDITGSTAKIALLGWTRKSLAEWWDHPIFTLQGFWVFWRDLVASFWRGEVKWQGQILAWPVADRFYAISSLVLLLIALVGLRKNSGLSTFQRQAIGIAALSFVVSVGFMALLSIQFDFGNCINPSLAHPYFTSGRLLTGALIPFSLFYVYGVAYFFRRINSAVALTVLGVIVVFVTTSEIVNSSVVFASTHNWFHR